MKKNQAYGYIAMVWIIVRSALQILAFFNGRCGQIFNIGKDFIMPRYL